MVDRHRQLIRRLTDDEYNAMLEAQDGHCAICPATPKTRRLHVDHDHASMQIRGLLCHRDNRVLPTWVTPEWLDSARRYLIRHELHAAGRLQYQSEDRGYSSPCWIWQRARHSGGYAVIRYAGELLYAHRLMYQGQIPKGHQIDHLCRTRECVNPAHLEAVTPLENSRRGMKATATHCQRGHEFTPENTYRRPGSGRRQCRACIFLRAAR